MTNTKNVKSFGRRVLAVLLALALCFSMIPLTTAYAANAGHKIRVPVREVIMKNGSYTYGNTVYKEVSCTYTTSHSSGNCAAKLSEFYPTSVGFSTTNWKGYTVGTTHNSTPANGTFYSWSSATVSLQVSMSGSEPYTSWSYVNLFYDGTTTTPTATPAPTATPTAAPTPAPTPAPTVPPSNEYITLNVRVFDVSNGKAYDIGTDYVKKGEKYIQSEDYTIPPLSKFAGNAGYGGVQKVVGNWYFPSGDQQVGSVVQWSSNSSKATMTYWVSFWNPDGGNDGGNGSGGIGSGSENVGSGTRYNWSQTVYYHANYPGGNDDTVAVTYNVTHSANTYTLTLKSYADCGFTCPQGYKVSSWWTAKEAGSKKSLESLTQSGKDIHVYAHYEEITTPPVGTTTAIVYMNGNKEFKRDVVEKGGMIVVRDMENTEDAMFLGWDENASATKLSDTYVPKQEVVLNENVTVYAVWKAKEAPATPTPEPTEEPTPTPEPTPEPEATPEPTPIPNPQTVQLVIYRNGNTDVPHKTVNLPKMAKGDTLDLSALDIGELYNATDDYTFDGWYNDNGWDNYKNNKPSNKLTGIITINGWTTLRCMITDAVPTPDPTPKPEERTETVQLMIYRNGDTSKVYKKVSLPKMAKGEGLNLSTVNIKEYYTVTDDFTFEGWYNDNGWNKYLNGDHGNTLTGVIVINGWTNLMCMVTDNTKVDDEPETPVEYVTVAIKAVKDGDKNSVWSVCTAKAPMGASLVETLNAMAERGEIAIPVVNGYTADYWWNWDWYGHKYGATATFNGYTNVYINYISNAPSPEG